MDKKTIFIEVDYDTARIAFETCHDIPNDLWLSCILCRDFEKCKRDYEMEKKNGNHLQD